MIWPWQTITPWQGGLTGLPPLALLAVTTTWALWFLSGHPGCGAVDHSESQRQFQFFRKDEHLNRVNQHPSCGDRR